MKNTINSLLAISAAAMLVACGGSGSGSGTANQNQNQNQQSASQSVASAGVFVDPAQTSATFNLVNCRLNPNGGGYAALNPATASLRIDANGDMTFTHAGQANPAVPAVSTTIVNSAASSAGLDMSVDTNGVIGYSAYLSSNGYASLSFYPTNKTVEVNLSGNNQYRCDFAVGTSMTAYIPDFHARIAAATAGITNVIGNQVNGFTFASPLATWGNDALNANNRIQLNITTGAVSVATQANGPFTGIDLNTRMTTANAAFEPSYSEERDTTGGNNTYSFLFESNDSPKNFFFRVDSGTDLTPSAQY